MVGLGIFSTRWQDAEDRFLGTARLNQVSCQLGWSCFIWDKISSLYFGRSPMIPEPPKAGPFIDVTVDEWDMSRPNAGLFKRTVIINDVLFNIYGSQRTREIPAFVRDTRQKLQTWRSQSPDAIRLDKSYQQGICLPPHILTQNMLYYTTMILLHRPFTGNSSCRAVCRESAEGVEHLLLLMEQTFGLDKCTYLMAYCSYTAATVAVQDTKDGIQGARVRLDTYSRALRGLKTSCPGIQRSIDIIAECLASNATTSSTHQNTVPTSLGHKIERGIGPHVADASKAPLEQMPAFPFSGGHANAPMHDSNSHGGVNAGLDDLVSHPFPHLDSYPQE